MSVLPKFDKATAQGAQLPVGLLAGANVRTPCGPRRIENLRPGDLVVTRKDGLQPVRMIWKRTISASEVAADPSLAPVVIAPRAVGPMMPQAELRLAACHGILLPGYRVEGMEDRDVCMIRARDFEQKSDDVRHEKQKRDLVFYNLVFDTHQIFAANGLMVESFLPTQTSICGFKSEELDLLEEIVPGVASGKADYPAVGLPVWDETAILAP